MTYQTVLLANYDDYLAFEYPAASNELAGPRAADIQERQFRLADFPHCALLQLSFAEYDYANRWCWRQFGPAHGECLQSESEYSACDLRPSHFHDGKWRFHWLTKTDYNFGFSEWYFAQQADRDRFLEFVPLINWGENYPK